MSGNELTDKSEFTQKSQSNTPGWYWTVSTVALIWNLLGVVAFIGHISMTPEMIAQMPVEQQALYQNTPGWVDIAFALGVFGGVLGSIGLLMRKTWSLPILSLSLVGVLLQNLYTFFLSDTFAVMGPLAMILPILVILIAIGLVIFSKSMIKKGIIRSSRS